MKDGSHQNVDGCGNSVPCRGLFKKFQILLLKSQYTSMLSLLMFVVQNRTLFLTNTENYNLDTRQRNNLYLPQANLTIYQKGAQRLRMLLVTRKKLKLLWKNVYTLIHFTPWKNNLVNCELRTILQKFEYSGITI